MALAIAPSPQPVVRLTLSQGVIALLRDQHGMTPEQIRAFLGISEEEYERALAGEIEIARVAAEAPVAVAA